MRVQFAIAAILVVLVIVFVVRGCINDESAEVREHAQREEYLEDILVKGQQLDYEKIERDRKALLADTHQSPRGIDKIKNFFKNNATSRRSLSGFSLEKLAKEISSDTDSSDLFPGTLRTELTT